MADVSVQTSPGYHNIYLGKKPGSVLFLDELPPVNPVGDSKVTSTEVKKWRFQQILANHPWGIPSLAFICDYKKFYERDLDLDMKEMGFHDFHQMITSLNDIFTIQKPDEISALIFPKYAEDFILHDARLKHNFDNMPTNSTPEDPNKIDYDALIGLANLNRDQPFPSDVALAGREYQEFILPQNLANIENTRGVYQVLIMGGRNPGLNVFVNFHNEVDKVQALINDLADYYVNLSSPRDTHLVPDEFIYSGFPCVLYNPKTKVWERCSIITKSKNKILVDMVDFGGIREALRLNLYLMPQKFLDIPKQVVCLTLAGLLPKDKISSTAALNRILNFSNLGYKLDCLILNPRNDMETDILELSTSSNENIELEDKPKRKKSRRKLGQKAQFEAIFCDRNDEDFDLFLDEILVIETHCKKDEARKDEIEKLRSEFKSALDKIPREICEI